MPLDRRAFLRASALAAITPSLSGLVACAGRGAAVDFGDWAPSPVPPPGRGSARTRTGPASYGPLTEVGPELALPAGFSYMKLSLGGQPLSDGDRVPGGHDGMACFSRPGRSDVVRLVRNHELAANPQRPETRRASGDPKRAYDRFAPGGTSTIEIRLGADGAPEVLGSWMSITGTLVNCAGGPTPWGSWLTCEETVLGAAAGYEKEHGYIFEVPAGRDMSDGPVDPVPLKAMGRFVHEAVAIDPATGVVYLTEDQLAAGFYRFIPKTPGRLRDGGRLQMLALADAEQYDTRKGQQPGQSRRARWVDIEDPDPANVTPQTIHQQGWSNGGATFGRLEGAWYGDGGIFFHATNGGDEGLGQVWFYRPDGDPRSDRSAGGDLLLVFESRTKDVLTAPDNITVSPRGGVLICEDSGGNVHLRGLSARGEVFPFAKNVFNNREFAGACFSPDGRVLFVNVQGAQAPPDNPTNVGMTFAIWGPWERGGL